MVKMVDSKPDGFVCSAGIVLISNRNLRHSLFMISFSCGCSPQQAAGNALATEFNAAYLKKTHYPENVKMQFGAKYLI